jgi:succinate-acetate transporter protein
MARSAARPTTDFFALIFGADPRALLCFVLSLRAFSQLKTPHHQRFTGDSNNMTQVETKPATTTATRPVANPAPLGLLGFGVTTLVLSLVGTNLFGTKLGVGEVFPLALAFGGGAQLLAGMWEFYAGNTFGATAFTGFGAFWISFFFLNGNVFGSADKAGSYGVATYLLGWAIFTGILTFGAWRVNAVTGSLFTLLFLTFVALALNGYGILGSGNTTLGQVGGWLGVITALNAFYNAAAGILKDLAGRDILPVFPMPK